MTKLSFFNVLLIISAIVFLPFTTKAQVTIGSAYDPQPFSVLELFSSGERGFRLPQLTTDQRNDMGVQYLTGNDSIAAMGLTIFNTTNFCVETWNGERWISHCRSDIQSCAEKGGVEINGVCWATGNLAVGGAGFVAPHEAGGLFQWGRDADGHENPASETISGPLDSAVPDRFITNIFDWLNPPNDALWQNGNDPCPAGWRVPTVDEWYSLGLGSRVHYWNGIGVMNGRVFGTAPNQIFLSAAGGGRHGYDGTLFGVDFRAFYWSSTPDGVSVRNFFFGEGAVGVSRLSRSNGASVRCVTEN